MPMHIARACFWGVIERFQNVELVLMQNGNDFPAPV